MADAGSHSPTSLGGKSEFDAGAHSPTSLGAYELFDSGAHSPTRALAYAGEIGAYVVSNGEDGYPDDGGEIITVGASWPIDGPYRIRLIGADATQFPSVLYCYSGIKGQGSVLYADFTKETVKFVQPPCPAGVYDIKIEFGAAYGNTVTLTDAIMVYPRQWDGPTFRMRSSLPPNVYKTGPRHLGAESAVPS